MSAIISMVSVAIIAGATITTAAATFLLEEMPAGEFNSDQMLETNFVDADLLLKTLNNHGCGVEVISENEIVVNTSCGCLRYIRQNAGEAFSLSISEISNPEELIENLRSFEIDYGRNVQQYTYDHIKENLTEDMSIASERVLEDDCLMLTINV